MAVQSRDCKPRIVFLKTGTRIIIRLPKYVEHEFENEYKLYLFSYSHSLLMRTFSNESYCTTSQWNELLDLGSERVKRHFYLIYMLNVVETIISG